MPFEVKLKHLHIAPRKVRLIADLVRGKKATEAQAILSFVVKKPGDPVLKLLNSALANAKNTTNTESGDLFISKITVDEGPVGKRIMPRARGKGERIRKRTSHVTLILDIKREKIKEVKEKKVKKEEIMNKKNES